MKKLMIVDAPNPVGKASNVLDEKVAALKAMWDEQTKQPAPTSWWGRVKPSLTAAVSFLVGCVDELIQHINEFKDMPGQDKKATVLLAASILYDYVVREALPLWLKPFAGSVKTLIISVMLSYMIDFFVDKYKNGLWRENGTEDKPSTT